jgi:hypothetical protein
MLALERGHKLQRKREQGVQQRRCAREASPEEPHRRTSDTQQLVELPAKGGGKEIASELNRGQKDSRCKLHGDKATNAAAR